MQNSSKSFDLEVNSVFFYSKFILLACPLYYSVTSKHSQFLPFIVL